MTAPDQLDIVDTIQKFDEYLFRNGQSFEAIVIGGAALNLIKTITRRTQDVDLIIPSILPKNIQDFAESFALENNINNKWFNTGPTSVIDYLPEGWETRTQIAFTGKSLNLKTLGKQELLMTKCWAYIDRDRDQLDIIKMKPTTYELQQARKWLYPLDGNPDWPQWVDERMDRLEKEVKKELSKSQGIGF